MATARTLLYAAVLGLLLQCCWGYWEFRPARKLQQSFGASAASPDTSLEGDTSEVMDVLQLYTVASDGGLILSGNITLIGQALTGATTVQKPIVRGLGLTSVLPSDGILAPALFEGTGCVSVSINATGSNVSGFLAPYANISGAATVTGYLDIDSIVPAEGSAFNNSNQFTAVVETNAYTTYQYIFYTTPTSDAQNLLNPNDDDALVQLGFQTHPVGSSACSGSGRELGAASPAEVNPYTASGTTSPYLVALNVITPFQIIPGRRVITGATCYRYNLLAQLLQTSHDGLDITILVTNQTGADLLLGQGGSVQADDVALKGSMCQQNANSWGFCQVALSNLDPNDFYWLWYISGLQDPQSIPDIAQTQIEYTASSDSDCASLTLPSHSLVQAPSVAATAQQPATATSSPPVQVPSSLNLVGQFPPSPAAPAPVRQPIPSPRTPQSPPVTASAPAATPPTGLLSSFTVPLGR